MQANRTSLDSPYFRPLTDEQLRAIHHATLHVLERTGVRLRHAKGREILRAAGAHVDGNIVRIPAALVEDAIRTAPSSITLYNRDGQPAIFLEGRRSYFGSVVDSPYVLDPYTHKLRTLVADDIRLQTLMADYCPHIAFISAWGGSASDYPPAVRDHIACKTVMQYTKKPFGTNAYNVQTLRDIMEMVAIVAGGHEALRRKPLTYHYSEPTSPLVHSDEAVEKLLLCAEMGIPLVYTPMTTAGGTGPATLAGTLVISNADALSGLVLHQLYRKGAPYIYGGMPSMMDMRTTTYSFGAPELALGSAALHELGHHYDLPTYGTAGASDAKVVDEQAAVEFALSSLMSALNGANLIHDVALIGGCTVVAPEAVLLNEEILGMVDAMVGGIRVDAETLAEEVIAQVGPGGHFLGEEHTRRHFRELWYPRLMDRTRTAAWIEAGEPRFSDTLNARTREILEMHTVDPLPDDALLLLGEEERRWMRTT